MILRRITQHVKDQNWFAVGIDFFIVVAGILIAFQITNWNEAQVDKAQAKELVARMVSEATSTLGELKNYRDSHHEVSTSAVELALLLNDNEKCLTAEQQLIVLILQVADFPPPRFSLPNAEQALQTGSLALIESTLLQDKVQSITDEMAFVERQWQRYMRVVQDSNRQVNKAAGVALTGRGQLITRRSYDPNSYTLLTQEKICGNTELISLISNLAVTKGVYVIYLNEVEIALDDYLLALKGKD